MTTSHTAADKAYLAQLTVALDAAPSQLRRDACGDWMLLGSRGHISTDGRGWYVYLGFETPRQWTFAKRRLLFLEVWQDGDCEGILRSSAMPTAEQAELVRAAIGLRRVRVLSDEQLDRLRQFHFAPRKTGTWAPHVRQSDDPVDRQPPAAERMETAP
jgi:hypothetical protein